jgi:hypothetical protein
MPDARRPRDESDDFVLTDERGRALADAEGNVVAVPSTEHRNSKKDSN